jgi:solute carrier family 29 (equilibrative nucleoside transporter), member 1/2/3
MILWLTLLNFLLTLSTFFKPSPGIFATFILVNGAAQAAAGGYFQTSLIAVASLFGPAAVQAMIAGQAAVAVVVSGVQVISSASSVRAGVDGEVNGDSSAEEKAAFIFFALSTIFLIASYLAHNWMIKLPIYDQVAGPLERTSQKITLGPEEGGSSHRRSISAVSLSRARAEVVEEYPNVIRVAKANALYEIAVACVFMVTLVSYHHRLIN